MNLPYIFSILLLVFGFGFVIFWHELGHFLAAKWVGIRVEQFAVGMGQAILAWRKGLGLRVGTTASDDYPALAWLRPQGRGVRITASDVEALLRSRTGRLPRGYGVVPLLGSVPELRAQAAGELQFSVHSPAHPAR